jgi:NAD(P)-dependent dehydrogenase (short-subunit alcohol dehydrogenase family)
MVSAYKGAICMFDFTDRVVLVAGASGNMGQAIASEFQTAGAHLVLLDREPERLPGLFPNLDASTDYLVPGSVDATEPSSVEKAVRTALDAYGHIDILANAVGGWRGGTPVHETPLETWDFMLNLNARSAFVLSQAVIPHMLERGSGKIVHTAARAGLKGVAGTSAYGASKSAVIRLVESLAAELKLEGINVNCVLPGTIDTPQNRKSMPKADHRRWVPPKAIADVVLFLASDLAWPVNGAAIPVYGQS